MKNKANEQTLDPLDWESMRELGHKMIDDMLEHMSSVREGPVWRHAPDQVKDKFRASLPREPLEPALVYQEFLDYVLPYPIGNTHPRFWGWFFGTGTVMGAYAEFLAGVMNTNPGDLDHHSAIHVENQVLNWFKEILGFSTDSSGLITSGCSAANLVGLTVARNAMAGYDMRRDGVNPQTGQMVLYASQEIHSSVQKAVEIIGLGNQALRLVPVDEVYRMDLEALKAMIKRDRNLGNHPFCIIGAAGTVNTGAFDDLDALADICQNEDLWLHVDGAYGAWLALVPDESHLVKGMARADSLAFDLHKWMYMQYELGCVLVKNRDVHRDAFTLTPVYLEGTKNGRGISGGDLPWFTDYGYQLSRKFASLKAWMDFKVNGLNKYTQIIQQNLDQVRYLVELIQNEPQLELAAPVLSNVVCFRYVDMGISEERLERINVEIMVELQERGSAVLSGTRLDDKFVLRVGHTNHRSRREDFEFLVREVQVIGEELRSDIKGLSV